MDDKTQIKLSPFRVVRILFYLLIGAAFNAIWFGVISNETCLVIGSKILLQKSNLAVWYVASGLLGLGFGAFDRSVFPFGERETIHFRKTELGEWFFGFPVGSFLMGFPIGLIGIDV
jgi:hypothetical protein